jgi:hypothetical protein
MNHKNGENPQAVKAKVEGKLTLSLNGEHPLTTKNIYLHKFPDFKKSGGFFMCIPDTDANMHVDFSFYKVGDDGETHNFLYPIDHDPIYTPWKVELNGKAYDIATGRLTMTAKENSRLLECTFIIKTKNNDTIEGILNSWELPSSTNPKKT